MRKVAGLLSVALAGCSFAMSKPADVGPRWCSNSRAAPIADALLGTALALPTVMAVPGLIDRMRGRHCTDGELLSCRGATEIAILVSVGTLAAFAGSIRGFKRAEECDELREHEVQQKIRVGLPPRTYDENTVAPPPPPRYR